MKPEKFSTHPQSDIPNACLHLSNNNIYISWLESNIQFCVVRIKHEIHMMGTYQFTHVEPKYTKLRGQGPELTPEVLHGARHT